MRVPAAARTNAGGDTGRNCETDGTKHILVTHILERTLSSGQLADSPVVETREETILACRDDPLMSTNDPPLHPEARPAYARMLNARRGSQAASRYLAGNW